MNFWMWLTWKLPNKLVYWASIRLITKATVGKYGNTVMSELTAMEAIERWDK